VKGVFGRPAFCIRHLQHAKPNVYGLATHVAKLTHLETETARQPFWGIPLSGEGTKPHEKALVLVEDRCSFMNKSDKLYLYS
jgi:hypothetical protein